MKSLLLTPLLISISFLNMGFMLKPKLKAVYCPSEKEYLTTKSFEYKWNDDFPWIYDVKTGKLYSYDDFLNQIDFMETYRIGDYLFSYKSRKIGNILKIREIETGPDMYEVTNTYSIDLDKNEVFQTSSRKKYDGLTFDCEKIDFPKGVKINY